MVNAEHRLIKITCIKAEIPNAAKISKFNDVNIVIIFHSCSYTICK